MPVRRKEGALLAADIGGTKTHVGLFEPGRRRPRLMVAATYASAAHAGLADILESFIREHPQRFSTVTIAVAGPVIAGRSRVTNLPWRITTQALHKRFGWSRVTMVNDLAAMATAIPYLQSGETLALNTRRRRPGLNLALMAPGTGLGTALLVARPGGGYQGVASEGGHVDWAPIEAEDLDLWRFLQRRFGHVSAERIGAGDGLANIFDWLVATGSRPAPAGLAGIPAENRPQAITRGALENREPLCCAALDKYVRLLGATAGNLVLTGMATGGLFLGGGIPPKILPALKTPLFMEAFLDKGRHDQLMARTPVRVITHPYVGLLGTAIHGFQDL